MGAANAAVPATNLSKGEVFFTSDGEEYGHIYFIDQDNKVINVVPELLEVKHGGTGKASHTYNSVLVGNDADEVKNIASLSGAFYATGTNDEPQFGILPLEQGGTGTSLVKTANAIIRFSSSGNYFSKTATGNGAFYATETNGAPVFGTLPVAQGGTGTTEYTPYRIIISSSTGNSLVGASNHFIDNSHLYINYVPDNNALDQFKGTASYHLYVNGISKFNNHITLVDEAEITYTIERKDPNRSGGWAYEPFKVAGNDGAVFANIGVYGSADAMNYMYFGEGTYNSTANVRITSLGSISIPADGTITPRTTATGSVGTSTYNWSEVYTRYLISSSTLYIDSASGTSLIFRPQGTEQARFNTSGQLQIKSSGSANATLVGPTTAGTFNFPDTGGTFVTHATKGTAVGGTAQPVYIATTGRATPLSATRGSASLPVYLNAGTITACTAGSVFSAFSSSANTLSITVATQTRTASIINSISNTWTGGTTAGPTLKTTVNGVAGTAVAIPVATASASGVVTTGSQTFGGSKTINGNLTVTASDDTYRTVYASNSNGTVSLHAATNRGLYDSTGDQWMIYRKKGETQTIIPDSLETPRIHLTSTTDAAHNANNNVALIIGSRTGTHIAMDNNEIFAKTDGTTAGTLYLQNGSGTTIIGNATIRNTQDPAITVEGRVDMGCLLLTNSGWTGYGTGGTSGLTAVTGRVYFKLV